jgi:hypothetical protein
MRGHRATFGLLGNLCERIRGGDFQRSASIPLGGLIQRRSGTSPLQPRYNGKTVHGKRAEDAEKARLPIFRAEEEESESVDQLEFSDSQTQRTSPFRGSCAARDAFKARGSLLSRLGGDAAMPTHSRMSVLRSRAEAVTAMARRKKSLSEKKVAVDVFIPSTLTVGTLARLLNVRLGMRISQRFMSCVQILSTTDRTTSTKDETGGHGERVRIRSR